MNTRTASALISLAFFGFLAGCGGGGGGAAAPPAPPPPPPPPVVPMSAAGIWVGTAVTPEAVDISTGFEFSDNNGFILGTAPFTVDFQGGETQTIGNPAFYNDGVFSWHISPAGASIVFGVPVESVTLFTRTTTNGDVASIEVLDEFGAQISLTAVTDNFVQIAEIPGMGAPLIGSVVITVAAGDEIVIDTFTSGFPSTASSDDIACLFAPNDEFNCIITDAMGALLSSANGTYSVNGDQVTGSGNLHAAPGETLADGSLIAALTISAGTVDESTSLNVTIASTGLSIAVTSLFDATYDRGADLATVGKIYTTFDIFGDMSSFAIDATTGVISGQSVAGCVLSGTVAVIDAAANTYDVNLVVANVGTCGALVGDYNGLGTSQDENATDDAFIFAVFVAGQLMIAGQAVE